MKSGIRVKSELCLDKMYSYLGRIAKDRIQGGKLVLLEFSAAQRDPEGQQEVFRRRSEHT